MKRVKAVHLVLFQNHRSGDPSEDFGGVLVHPRLEDMPQSFGRVNEVPMRPIRLFVDGMIHLGGASTETLPQKTSCPEWRGLTRRQSKTGRRSRIWKL